MNGGNYSLEISYNKTYSQGGGTLNYFFEKGEDFSEYRWISAWLYYPELPPPNTYIELDLFNVDYIDSSGLATLISFIKMIRASGKTIKLSNKKENVSELIHLSGLDRFILG